MKEIIYSCSSRGEPAGSWIDHGLEGKQKALRIAFLRMRFARQKNYRLREIFRAVTDNNLSATPGKGSGKKEEGGPWVGIPDYQRRQDAIWEATFNV